MGYKRKEIIGDCTLYLGDCMDVMPTLPKVDYSFTSPPYNRKRNDKYKNFNDVNEEWGLMNIKCIENLLKISNEHVFYNVQTNYYNRKDVYNIIGYFQDYISDIHIWEKKNPMPSGFGVVCNAVEYFLVLNRGGYGIKSNGANVKNIIKSSVNSDMPKEHKAVMHQDISDYFILNFTKPKTSILDCFLGTGTTGVTCAKMGRSFIGIELNEEYFEIACERIRKAYEQPDMFIEIEKQEYKQDSLI